MSLNKSKKSYLKELYDFWLSRRNEISSRLGDFRSVWKNGTDERIFEELVFCLFTPQSKAKSCWASVCFLKDRNLIMKGKHGQIAKRINTVRFRNNKAKYLVSARRLFANSGKLDIKRIISSFPDAASAREWLVKNVKGMGYKEAGHFLRNIGLGEEIAILDRHILKNLKTAGVIGRIPKTISAKEYLTIEQKMIEFSKSAGIPLSHLDLLLWCRETGEIFK
ncbi:MAG: N-glycosylase/DNA lyase [Endomicrobiales bacterium]|nr:N-glycosylase/DNA lyase [Endomicrobiales bacterium]